MPAASSAQPEFECLRGAMGALGEERVSFPFHSVWGRSLRRAMKNFCEHYHGERNHQGKGNVLLFPGEGKLTKSRDASIECRERLGGLLKYYYQRAA